MKQSGVNEIEKQIMLYHHMVLYFMPISVYSKHAKVNHCKKKTIDIDKTVCGYILCQNSSEENTLAGVWGTNSF